MIRFATYKKKRGSFGIDNRLQSKNPVNTIFFDVCKVFQQFRESF